MEGTKQTKQATVTNEQIMQHLMLQNRALALIVNALDTLIISNDNIGNKEKAIADFALQHMVEDLSKTCGLDKKVDGDVAEIINKIFEMITK